MFCRFFRSYTLIILFLFASFLFAAQTEQLQINEFLPVQVRDRVITENGINLSLDISEPVWTTVGTTSNPVEITEFINGGVLEVEGFPVVPSVGSMFRIPPNSAVVIEVLNSEYDTYTGIDYANYFGGSTPGELKPAKKPEDNWYPGVIAQSGEPAVFHDFRVANLITYPVQVNTARREVRVYRNIELSISYEGLDNRNTIPALPSKISEAFVPWYRLLLDWDESELDEYELYRGKVQVIMQDDNAVWNNLEPWIEWKLQRGWDLEFLTDDDVVWNTNGIKEELEERFESNAHHFDYVVIIGDDTGGFPVPPGSSAGYGAGDLGYSTLAGNDLIPDVHIGRISVESTTQLRAYVNKVLTYERDIDLNDTDWYLRGAVHASSASTGTSTIFVGHYCRNAMFKLGFTRVDTAWYNDGLGNTLSRMRTSINRGVSYYNHRGFIGTGFDAAWIENFTNTDNTPVVFDVTCQTGNWSRDTGINEAWMRAGSVNLPRGAIGAFGTATGGTHTRFNNCLNGGTAFSLLVMRNLCMGDANTGAKVNLYTHFNGNDNAYISFMQWLNLMGDPTVWVWTGIPRELEVTASGEFELGTNTYSVLVEDEQTGDPVGGAWITLYKVDDDEQTIIRGITNAEGRVTLDAVFESIGDVILTVSAQHFAPFQDEIEAVDPADLIGYESISIIDDNSQGTVGNSNGIPEAGETIGLMITARNYGWERRTNVVAVVTSENPWVTDIDNEIDYGSVIPGDSEEGDNIILVEIAEHAQNRGNISFDLSFNSDEGTDETIFSITVSSIQFVATNVDYVGDPPDPGRWGELSITVGNIGGSNAAGPCDAFLLSRDPWLIITEPDGNFQTINVGNEGISSRFGVMPHEDAVVGESADVVLIIESADGLIDTVSVSIQIGNRSSDDPCGPDSYGYYAFDNTDTDYTDYVPEYDWVEIRHNGTNLNIYDGGNNSDDAAVIDLPFDVQFYGESFDEITVTANGFLAMGNQGMVRTPRNWTIPSPLGPDYMIAPYWDERRSYNSVYSYYDRNNDRFIVEWYQVADVNNTNRCTFEVIIYDQDGDHITESGDNDFLFQYHTISHSPGLYSDVPYWTTGIENGNQTDGILIYFWNQAAPGAASISNGRAIFFTTNVIPPYGSIEGIVTDLEDGEPIEGVIVRTSDLIYSTITDDEGFYRIEEVMEGEFSLEILKNCFVTGTIDEVDVVENEVTEVNYEMTYPLFELEPDSIMQHVAPDSFAILSLTLGNDGNGLLQYSTHIDFTGDGTIVERNKRRNEIHGQGESELDNPWDELLNFTLTEDESRNRGVVFAGDYFYVSGSDNFNPTGPNKIYQYNRDGELQNTFDQPVSEELRSPQGFFGMTWDGEYLYGVDNDRLIQMEISEDAITMVDTLAIPVQDVKYLVYDENHDWFWMGNTNSPITAINRDGEIEVEVNQDFAPRGAGWYPEDRDGYKIYLIGRVAGENNTRIVKMDAETGDLDVVRTFNDPDGELIPGGANITFLWDTRYWTFITVIDNDGNDNLMVWELGEYTTWAEVINPSGSVDPGDSLVISLRLRSTGMPRGRTYSCQVYFDHNACTEENEVVSVFMDTYDDDVLSEISMQPFEWELGEIYPNPFNPVTTINFALRENVHVYARVYNLLGREVAVLTDEPMTSGHHSLLFDGTHLTSGMYFLQFSAGPLHEIRKIVLLK
ncbi:MAG: C25 family cysteine peptidase [Candidatus Electryonea clarkiae]|nr:C25 family cysteine peptidase [Candidatus Electryonea clarkiae]MDP8287265.1 C25 family cysteine peptidase [Candidatus Electryonea clarkiae]